MTEGLRLAGPAIFAALTWMAAGSAAVAQAPGDTIDASALTGDACIGLVGHVRKVNPLPARGPGGVGRIPSDGSDKVLALSGCDASSFIVRYDDADWAVSRSLLDVRWLRTGDRLDGGALITPAMREKAIIIARTPVKAGSQATPDCDSLASVTGPDSTRIFGAAGLAATPKCRSN